jgi:hypothetical protein
MDFQYSGEIWCDFPELVPGVIFAAGITHDVPVGDHAVRFTAIHQCERRQDRYRHFRDKDSLG